MSTDYDNLILLLLTFILLSNIIMFMKKALPYILILLISFVIALIAFLLLPNQIPIQWTSNGVRYGSKYLVFIFALIPFAVYASIKAKKSN